MSPKEDDLILRYVRSRTASMLPVQLEGGNSLISGYSRSLASFNDLLETSTFDF